MANEFKVKNGIITPSLQSTATTGTSPLTVASTTLVSNLNADLLDGNHAGAFYLATNPSGYTTNTGTVTSIAAGSYLTGGTITTSGTLAVDATSANTSSKVVARDANGDFSANVITAADFNATSDARLKDNVADAPGLSKVLGINPVEFTWKSSGAKSYGVLAQELEQLLPELVQTDVANYKSVSYIPLIALLVKSVQELYSELQQLKTAQ